VTTAESAFVFNIVWTGSVFPYLRHFVASQLRHSGARVRFVANGCPDSEVALMEEFAATTGGRVTDVFVSSAIMTRHGAALDAVFPARDDGEFFCFVDPDILARRPYLPEFIEVLDQGCAGVTSGKGVWTDDVVVPPGHPGVPGECFYSQEGYLFGSPHFAIYRRAPLEETVSRWGAGFGSAGGDLTPDTKKALAAAGHRYWIYDTGKVVNILLQEDGHRLSHVEHPALLHIGGMSHYLAPPRGREGPQAKGEASDLGLPWPPARLQVAAYTAALLRALSDGEPAPVPPSDLHPDLADRLDRVRAAVVDLFTPEALAPVSAPISVAGAGSTSRTSARTARPPRRRLGVAARLQRRARRDQP